MPYTFTDADYREARSILCRRYSKLAGSDVMDEMVQRAAVKIWNARCSGREVLTRSALFRIICQQVAVDIVREASTSWVDGAETLLEDDSVSDTASGPEGRTVSTEFVEALPPEEREIVWLLLRCGDRRDMRDVAEMTGAKHARVNHVLWKLRKRLREEAAERGDGSLLG